MTESVLETTTPTESDTEITRRMEAALRTVREDEARYKRIIEVRRLTRRAKTRQRSK